MSYDADLLADFLGVARSTVAPETEPADAPDGPRLTLLQECEARAKQEPDRMPWPETWFTTRDPGDAAACHRMFAKALLERIKDTIRECIKNLTGKAPPPRDHGGFIGSPDFMFLARMAGVDAEGARDRLRGMLHDPVALRASLDRLVRKDDPEDESHAPQHI